MSGTRQANGTTLAHRFLEDARDGRWPVSVYLVNGFQLKGEIAAFDQDAVLINHKDSHQLVMRSAVASMYPLPAPKQSVDDWWRAYVSSTNQQQST